MAQQSVISLRLSADDFASLEFALALEPMWRYLAGGENIIVG